MKEYIVMLLVFIVTLFIFGWFFGALFIAWIISGRAALYKKGIDLSEDGIASYWFYFAWPFYLRKFQNRSQGKMK